MIIDVDYIRTIRPVAENIDPNRLRMFITEAEKIDILPAIGAGLYRKLDGFGPVTIDSDGTLLLDEHGHPIFVNAEAPISDNEALLLTGGYYTDNCGCEQYFEGLCLALAYLAYARLLREHSLNVTAYGVVIKEGELSSPADTRDISGAALNTQHIGEAYLGRTLRYWHHISQCKGCGGVTPSKRNPRFLKIGK